MTGEAPANGPTAAFWAPLARLPGRRGWSREVLLRAGPNGRWVEIAAGVPAPEGATALAGPVVAGVVDAHSHAFQRAFAGLAERREGARDDFWSWRERMYAVAGRITVDELRAVAAQVYAELLLGGYTHVCEFHYLHGPVGAHGEPQAAAEALVAAAAEAGIGLTLLPALYERAGFAEPEPLHEQRRFALGAAGVGALRETIAAEGRARGRSLLLAGLACHSLRAVSPQGVADLRRMADAAGDVPIHVHAAEQRREVEECLAATGRRPVEWLAAHGLDARWQLVHATHVTAAEVDAVAGRGAGVVLCPGTEANLGDGVTDLPAWLAAGVPLAVGSDSQVTRSWAQELRLLELGQRLVRRERNVAADPPREPATAARLLDAVVAGGGPAAGLPVWGLRAGARADLIVLDPAADGLIGVPTGHALDALVFAGSGTGVRDVVVAGRLVVRERRLAGQAEIAARFARAMDSLWDGPRPT